MSSLSFENLFPSDSGERNDNQSLPAAGRHSGRLPAAWAKPLDSDSAGQTSGDASAWALSHARRAVDFVVAATALLILMPVIVAAAVLVRFGSDGPVFFRQKRMGRNGKEFTLYKFRSMRCEGECGSSITVMGDARITPVGGFLRRYKLDELPQFWNVLRGDMSLVGPRPKLPHHEALHMTCRPGITGVATLAFHREEEFLSGVPEQELEAFYECFVKPAKAQMDLEYLRAATLGSDLRVLFRTLTSCLLKSRDSSFGPAESIAQYAAGKTAPERAGGAVESSGHYQPEIRVPALSVKSEA